MKIEEVFLKLKQAKSNVLQSDEKQQNKHNASNITFYSSANVNGKDFEMNSNQNNTNPMFAPNPAAASEYVFPPPPNFNRPFDILANIPPPPSNLISSNKHVCSTNFTNSNNNNATAITKTPANLSFGLDENIMSEFLFQEQLPSVTAQPENQAPNFPPQQQARFPSSEMNRKEPQPSQQFIQDQFHYHRPTNSHHPKQQPKQPLLQPPQSFLSHPEFCWAPINNQYGPPPPLIMDSRLAYPIMPPPFRFQPVMFGDPRMYKNYYNRTLNNLVTVPQQRQQHQQSNLPQQHQQSNLPQQHQQFNLPQQHQQFNLPQQHQQFNLLQQHQQHQQSNLPQHQQLQQQQQQHQKGMVILKRPGKESVNGSIVHHNQSSSEKKYNRIIDNTKHHERKNANIRNIQSNSKSDPTRNLQNVQGASGADNLDENFDRLDINTNVENYTSLKVIKIKQSKEKYVETILNKFKYDLLNSDQTIEEILFNYNRNTCTYIHSCVVAYFDHLEERLQIPQINYLDLIDVRQYPFEDFGSYRQRFRQFISDSGFYNKKQIKHYHSLIAKYDSLYPQDILEFRDCLLSLKNSLNIDRNKKMLIIDKCLIDYQSVTYQKIDEQKLYAKILELENFQDKFNYFNSKYALSPECRENMLKFVHSLENTLKSKFKKFSPVVHTFGSISNGLGTSNSDFDLFIKFQDIDADILDFPTSLLALEVIEKLMTRDIGIQIKNNCIIQSRRCPIIKLNFKNCLGHLYGQIPREERSTIEFTKCDISLRSMYGVYNSKLVNFYTRYDTRFYEMSMALKYWAKNNQLISQNKFSTYAFTMLIIFYLETQSPPVLPTLVELQEILANKSDKKLVHRWNFEFCQDVCQIGKSKNKETTRTLLVKFFKYYTKFNFYLYAIRPRNGTIVLKRKLNLEKEEKNLHQFNMASYFCIEDPFVLDHNVAFNFRTKNVPHFLKCLHTVAAKIDEDNCLDVLLDGSLPVEPGPDIYPVNNFYKYQLNYHPVEKSYSLILRSTDLNDVSSLWKQVMIFFKHITGILFENYFFIKKFDLRCQKENCSLVCYIDEPSLETLISTRFWSSSKQFVCSKNPESIEWLRTFRNKVKKEFKNKTSTSSAQQSNNAKMLECFRLNYQKDNNNMFACFDVYATDNRTFPLLDIILSLFQLFLHAVDRPNAIETFDNTYETFTTFK